MLSVAARKIVLRVQPAQKLVWYGSGCVTLG